MHGLETTYSTNGTRVKPETQVCSTAVLVTQEHDTRMQTNAVTVPEGAYENYRVTRAHCDGRESDVEEEGENQSDGDPPNSDQGSL
jgi:hypothetical protein